MSVRRADVYKGSVRAATLERTDEGTRFAYLDDYRGPDVATTLLRSQTPVITPGASVPPYFAGLLPEGRRLTAVRRAIKASADDELSLLAAVGADTIGDVAIAPSGAAVVEVDPGIVVRAGTVDRPFAELIGDDARIDRVGIPGVQDKVSGRMISYPTRGSGADYILKLDPPEFPHVVENEHRFLEIARSCGIRTVAARVVRDVEDRPGLLVTRFDRVYDGGAVRRLGVEDACQAARAWPADKYSLGAERAVRALTANCAAAVVAARDLFRQFVFASLTGNGDLHAKNIAMIRAEGEWRITPAYDLPCTLFYGDDTMALEVDGSTAPLSRRRARALAEAIGLPPRMADRIVDDLLGRLAGLPDDVADGMLPFADASNRKVAKGLAYRRRQLAG